MHRTISSFKSINLKILAISVASIIGFNSLANNSAYAQSQVEPFDSIMIPQIGTAGVQGISVPKEIAIGDFFMRSAHAYLPILDDPVLNEYVSTLGNKLLSHADNVNFPFTFFVVKDSTLNASAFLGGKVAINTGLFKYAQTEDEFASVIAHEISHVTQRHIARFVEKAVVANQLSMAGLIGAVVMSIVNPALGMAAFSTTMGAQMQSRINFTRHNEYEADRIGITLLYKAGMNPNGAVNMFKRLLAQQGNVNPVFTLLIDHPLSDIRVAEAQLRANQYPTRQNSNNPDYDMAQARILVRYDGLKSQSDYEQLKEVLKFNKDKKSSIYINYALALLSFEQKKYEEALSYLKKMPSNLSDSLFVIDLKTDIALQQGRHDYAIKLLKDKYRIMPSNQVVVINLANVYNESAQYDLTIKLLNKYLNNKPKDLLALRLLEHAYSKSNNKCDAMQTRGEIYALSSAYQQSISLYSQALRECSDMLTRERIKARVSQIAIERSFDEALLKK